MSTRTRRPIGRQVVPTTGDPADSRVARFTVASTRVGGGVPADADSVSVCQKIGQSASQIPRRTSRFRYSSRPRASR
jgi:hypothetical protein